MVRQLQNLARWALDKMGYQVQSKRLADLRAGFDRTLVHWTQHHFRLDPDDTYKALGVVFSKDRSLQLHALLESWFAQVRGDARMVVLWTASDTEHEAAYRELMHLWAGKVEWVREQSFRRDLLELIAQDRSSHLFFITDDAVVLHPFSLQTALLPDPDRRVFSLCHAPNLHWCFVSQKPQRVPPLRPLDSGLLGWDWSEGEAGTDWSFPLSVDGKFFARAELELLLQELPFRSPNTLEESLQVYLPIFAGREGVCHNQAMLVNIPCNMVQTQYANPITGTFSTRELLQHWQQGERICWEDFAGMAPDVAEKQRYRFGPRTLRP